MSEFLSINLSKNRKRIMEYENNDLTSQGWGKHNINSSTSFVQNAGGVERVMDWYLPK